MLPEKVQAVVDDLVAFHCRNIKPDQIYLVVLQGGAARFNWLQMQTGAPCNVIPTAKGPIPIRDYHIYAVAPGKPRAGEIDVATADLLHSKMCAAGKKGAEVTLGDIHTAARAEVLARLTDAGLVVDPEVTKSPDLVQGTLGSMVDEGTVDPAAKEPLPADTAVQIVVGDQVMSDPFRTAKEAEESAQYQAYLALPEVRSGQKLIWLRPINEGPT